MIGDDETNFCPNFKPEQLKDMGIKSNEDFMEGHIKEETSMFDPNSPYWWLRSEEAYKDWGKGPALDNLKKELGEKLVPIDKLKEVQEVKRKKYTDMEKRKEYRKEWMKKKRLEKVNRGCKGKLTDE